MGTYRNHYFDKVGLGEHIVKYQFRYYKIFLQN